MFKSGHQIARAKSSALGFDLVAIRLVLRLEIKVLVGWTKEHLTAHCQQLHTESLLLVRFT